MPKLALKPAHELIPLMLESKRQMLEEMKVSINRPEIKEAVEKLKKMSNQ